MSTYEEIMNTSDGAYFRRADLHIHSFGACGSYDVLDTAMTPEAIVETALAENLEVIAITDHNSIGNVRSGLNAAKDKDILVVPGVELSTPQGHLLVYCPTVESLEGFFGKLSITPDRKACQNTIPQCLKLAHEHGGFGIAAHIDVDAGFELMHPKYDAFKQDILNCPNLLGLEVKKASNCHWFSYHDDDANRKNCAVVRGKHLGHEEEVDLARVLNSDAHSIVTLGKNAQGDKRLTRYKMEDLNFESLRLALIDCTARVRLEDTVPASFPHFVGMKLEGGFLKGQTVRFSKNLTCIIGGRGAGKSTMLESLRVCSGNSVENSLIDSTVWPDEVTLFYQDEVGEVHTLIRSKMDDVRNVNDPINGITKVEIESYGQGETASTIKNCDKDPYILLNFLDSFLNNEGIPQRDVQIRDELMNNQTEIERLTIRINTITDIETAKKTADQQVEALKKQSAKELVELESKLANERRFRQTLTTKLTELIKGINSSLTSGPIKELIEELGQTELAVGKEECDQVQQLLTDLSGKIDELSGTLKGDMKTYAHSILEKFKIWVAKEQDTQNRIEAIRKELEKQKIKLDMAFIRKVTKDANDYAAQLIELRKLPPLKEAALKQRRDLTEERKKLKARAFTIRQSFATNINKNLSLTVIDYNVTVKFVEGVLADALEELIKNAMEWRTSQVPKAALIARAMSPFTLLEALNKKNTLPFEAIRDSNGAKVFSKNDATQVINVLGLWRHKTAIERCEFEDLPTITVSRTVPLDDGGMSVIKKDFSKLSLGQQQSILLSIMLFSKSTRPLIIDQPEDNLDSEFIYKTLVRTLRSVKEQRQVIIVTHNANIAVLGDAELIVPLRGASETSVVRDRGSIDTPETKALVCTILEGSKEAFRRRRTVYGI